MFLFGQYQMWICMGWSTNYQIQNTFFYIFYYYLDLNHSENKMLKKQDKKLERYHTTWIYDICLIWRSIISTFQVYLGILNTEFSTIISNSNFEPKPSTFLGIFNQVWFMGINGMLVMDSLVCINIIYRLLYILHCTLII